MRARANPAGDIYGLAGFALYARAAPTASEESGVMHRMFFSDPDLPADHDYLWRCEPCRLIYDPNEEHAVDGRCPRCGERTQPVKHAALGECAARSKEG